jgi:membrane associated rhomboid family serine protease
MNYRSSRDFQFNVTMTLIGINLAVFVAIYIAAFFHVRLTDSLGVRPATISTMPWTIVSAMFTHEDFFHILSNMLALYFFGTYLSGMVGENKLLLVYLCGGILGNIFYLLLPPNIAPAIGASGAIYAIGGALVVMRPTTKVYIIPIPAPIPLWIAVLGGFLIISFGVPGIAWQAHLGGLIFGLAAGYYFKKQERSSGYYRY